MSRSSCSRSNGAASTCRLPDSILARSSTSLIRPSSRLPALWITRSRDCVSSGSLRSAISSCVKPSTALSGVRISWLMLARNTLLLRLARSASSLAASSAAIMRRRSLTSRSTACSRLWPLWRNRLIVISASNCAPSRRRQRHSNVFMPPALMSATCSAASARGRLAVGLHVGREQRHRLAQQPAARAGAQQFGGAPVAVDDHRVADDQDGVAGGLERGAEARLAGLEREVGGVDLGHVARDAHDADDRRRGRRARPSS